MYARSSHLELFQWQIANKQKWYIIRTLIEWFNGWDSGLIILIHLAFDYYRQRSIVNQIKILFWHFH